jgi:DNA-directed RNA polymerase subunit RPC12/RpoP
VETYEVVCFGSAISHRCTIMAARLGLLRDRRKKGDETMTDIVCPHCGRKIRLNIETDPPAILVRVDVTKPKETKQ